MIKKMIKSVVNNLGFEIARSRKNVSDQQGFEVYNYYRIDGSLDYDKYREVQQAGNRRKIENIWVLEENIAFLASYLKRVVGQIQFGICHGTRRGKEQEWFRKYLGCNVIGTEISDTATQFPNTIQWDFHETKPEWINSVDFIYSNSFDHSYDPEKCMNAWMSCIRPGGVCILEHTSGHELATELDPFGAHVSHMPYLVLTWGKGKFCVREILDAPAKGDSLQYSKMIVIQRI